MAGRGWPGDAQLGHEAVVNMCCDSPRSRAEGVTMVRSPMRMRVPARSAWRTSSSHTNSATPPGAAGEAESDDTVELVGNGTATAAGDGAPPVPVTGASVDL